MRLPNPLAAYRRWRERLTVWLEERRLNRAAKVGDTHAVCEVVRRQLFWFTGDPSVLDLTDEELVEGMGHVGEAIRATGLTTEEAANAFTAAMRPLTP